MMRGASAEARADLSQKVRDAGSSEQVGSLGTDLLGVSELLAAEAALRRAVTDPATEGSAKAELVRRLLDDKIARGALDVVADAVTRRWAGTLDLPRALEDLGVQAVVRGAGDDAGRVSDELFAVNQLVEHDADLRSALSDPARSADDKFRLLDDLLQSKVHPATLTLVQQSLRGGHRTVGVALDAYSKIAADVRGESVAVVRTARPLSESDTRRLTDALSRQYDRRIHLQVMVDPDLIGGLRVEIGEDVIDGTIASRLDHARRKLVS